MEVIIKRTTVSEARSGSPLERGLGGLKQTKSRFPHERLAACLRLFCKQDDRF